VSRAAVLLALGALSYLPPYPVIAAGSVSVERTLYLMGTRATLAVESTDRAAAVRQLERMVRSLERTEATLSTWRYASELSRLNRHPVGQPFKLGPEVCALWPTLTHWHRTTAGAFDPGVGALIDVWGLREHGRRPPADRLAAAWAVTGFGHFEADPDPDACRVTRLVDATLDAGAFGKGEALRRLQVDLGGDAVWRVDLGGQVAVSGMAPSSGRWSVDVAHPARRYEAAMEVVLATGSLATSGASERTLEVDGEPIAHILDPRTGHTLYRHTSVTVWHDDPLVADILSTALYVLGPDTGMRFAESHGLAALFLVPPHSSESMAVSVRPSQAFADRFPTRAGAGHPTVP
jgi:thiamine biosynthesis lipoprotein